VLEIDGTLITDASFVTIGQMTKLERIHIERTQVTEAGVKKFAKSNDKCRIHWSGGIIGK
jgi:hypothetical protein